MSQLVAEWSERKRAVGGCVRRIKESEAVAIFTDSSVHSCVVGQELNIAGVLLQSMQARALAQGE